MRKQLIVPSLLLSLGTLVQGAAVAAGADPVTADLPLDAEHPPAMVELAIDSHGARLNGFLYLAQGAGLHPAVALLHGYPGNERNLDLAQALRRAGYDVLFFDYRGSWGSGGVFSWSHALEDVAAAVGFLRSAAARTEHRVDGGRIALVGHSFGGWLALEAAAADPRIRCVASLSGVNLGGGRLDDPAGDAAWRAYLEATNHPDSGPIRAASVEALHREAAVERARFDLLGLVPRLKDRGVLLIAAARDTGVPPADHHEPLVRALTAGGAQRLDSELFDDDHAYSAHRVALARTVVHWLDGCSAAVPAGP